MFRYLACIACATMTLFTTLPAAADSLATARVHSFNYTLIDLAPDDGHTPWLQFGPAPTASARVWLYNTIPQGYQDWTRTYYQAAGESPLDYAYASSNAQMSSHLDPRQPLAEMQLESSNMSRSVNGSITYNGVELSTGQMRFNVSAYTAVVFTASIDYDVRTTAQLPLQEGASGYSILEAGLDGLGWDSSYAGFNPMQNEFGPKHYTGESLLFLTQINDGAAQTGGYLDLSLITFAGSGPPLAPPPVPEPGSLGMLLTGGLLVGAILLQRRRRASALLQAALLAPALLAAGPASASVSNGSIRVQDLSFILVDLRPSDGIAPSLTYTGTGQKSYFATIVDHSLGDTPAVDVHASALASAPVSNSYATPWHQAQLALAARPTINAIDEGASYTLSSRADHPDSVEVGYTSKLDFLLGPGTAVLFTAHARGHVDFGGGSTPSDAYFSAHMDAWFPQPSNSTDFYQSFDSTLLPSSADVNWLLLASARNTGNDPFFMTLTIQAALGGTVTAVPEPEAVWMLLAGGLILAAAVRRTSGARPRPQRAASAA